MKDSRLIQAVKDKPPTKTEARRYNALLSQIKEDIQVAESALIRIAHALKAIKEDRLYRAHYATFEEFIQAELGKDRSYGYRLIKSYDVLAGLLEDGVSAANLPSTERLCRELARLEPALRKNVWERAMLMAEQEKKPIDHKLIQLSMEEQTRDYQDDGQGTPHDEKHQPDKKVLSRQARQIIDDLSLVHKKVSVNLDFHLFDLDDLKSFKSRAQDAAFRLGLLLKQAEAELTARGELTGTSKKKD